MSSRLHTHAAPAMFFACMIASCTPSHQEPRAHTPAAGIARAVIVDTHIDTPIRIHMAPDRAGDFDLARARAGGLGVAFMSIFVPGSVDGRGEGRAFADRLIDHVDQLVVTNPDDFARATCVDDVRRNVASGHVSLAYGMENGGPLAAGPDTLEHFRARGIRYVTLTHAASNAFSDSSYSEARPHRGLSAAGKELVAHLNDLGVMVDVSHISDAAFWQVLEVSNAPVIASHSSARHFTPGFERNMSDEMIVALAGKGGVVQVNFGSAFVTQRAREWTARRDAHLRQTILERRLAPESSEAQALVREYGQQHPFPFADLSDVVDHIEHMIQLAGVEHVGLGSDFDGVGDTLPGRLKDVSAYPNLIAELAARGYSEDEIKRVLGENLLRVWRRVEDYATERGNPPVCSQS